MALTRDDLRTAPKVVLHDHLDGSLRSATVLELAEEIGHALPTHDVEELRSWFHVGANRRDLDAYLSVFEHTVAVMQSSDNLERVAYESAVDLADDGVVYAELRYAPELNTTRGLSLDDVLEATTAGFGRAMQDREITVRTIVCALRNEDRARAAADAAVRWADRGVVAFDLAGPEDGYPPTEHLSAIRTAQEAGLQVTLHAGEGFGLASIREAVEDCHADRLGHGVRLIQDVRGEDLGPLASHVRTQGIPLEVCPSSNVHTGAVASFHEHPVDRLLDLGFAVTVNTDNRLMSATTMTDEFLRCAEVFGWDADRITTLLRNAADAAFCTDAEHADLHTRIDTWVDRVTA